MFRIFLKGLVLLICFWVLVVFVNFKVDKYGFFQGKIFEREVVEDLLAGNAIAYDEVSFDEREIMRLYIQNMPEALDTAVIGSSRALQLTKDFSTNPDSFFNFGVSGGDFRDFVNTVYYMEKAEKLPKNIILVVEPYFFNGGKDAISLRSDEQSYYEVLSEILKIPVEYEKPDYATMLETVVSPSVFQENIEFYFRDTTSENCPIIYDVNSYKEDKALRLPDGTQLYPLSYRKQTQDKIDFAALEMITYSLFRLEGITEIDATQQNYFESFVKHIKSKGINVVFVLPSYHPILYEKSLQESYRFPAFFDIEPYILNFAKCQNIDVYGSYDPAVTDCKTSDFYDGLHMKREAIKKVFSGYKGSEVYNYLEKNDQMVYPRGTNIQAAEDNADEDADAETENLPQAAEPPQTARIPKG